MYRYRIFEIIPGFLVWTTFVCSILFSFIAPLWVIYFIIIFSLLWLLRVLYFVIFVFHGWIAYRRALQVDWYQKLRANADWREIRHLIFLPMYQEPYEVVEETFEALLASKYPKEHMIVVLAGEERSKEHFAKVSKAISKKYASKFAHILITLHPDNLRGEIKAKGANANWAGHRAQEYIDDIKIPYENIIVSYFDVDTVVHPQYFAHLTQTFLSHPDRLRTSYQPAVLYNNNIWDAPMVTRISAFGTTFWLFTELARPDRLFTFSSHSMPFKALVDVGFWEKDKVTDDSRIFLQCFVRYQGDYTVTPLFIPVSMDTVTAPTLLRAAINLYKQQRRWAWGVEHFPYMMEKFFFTPNTIPFRLKIKYLFNHVEGMYTWATAPILLFLLGYLPLYVAPAELKATALAQAAPYVLQWLMSASMIGIFASAGISLFLLLPKPMGQPHHKIITMILQWFLLPVTFILFGAIPAIESQTRLMLGKYLGFWVTEKSRGRK
ncbi:MAG: glycosyltransferase family 2 protein [Parcubacteria group bacterium]|nr:glycosyltransferase family 2 protein [Parcubacteria group bacterium]